MSSNLFFRNVGMSSIVFNTFGKFYCKNVFITCWKTALLPSHNAGMLECLHYVLVNCFIALLSSSYVSLPQITTCTLLKESSKEEILRLYCCCCHHPHYKFLFSNLFGRQQRGIQKNSLASHSSWQYDGYD